MLRKNSLRVILSFSLIFISCGIVHIFFRNIPYNDCIMQFIYGSLVLIWGFTINRRIIDKRVKYLIMGIVGFMELFFILQLCKYQLFDFSPNIRRYIWYGYYVPMLCIPLLFFYIALFMNLQEDEAPGKKWIFLCVPVVILIVGFLTNDLHHLAFYLPKGVLCDNGQQEQRILINIFWVVSLLLFVASIAIMLKKCSIPASQRNMWIPTIPILLSVIFFIIYRVNAGTPSIAGYRLWQMTEVYGFMTVCFLETCIQIGMIPANKGYEKIFNTIKYPAKIQDISGNVVYSTSSETKVEPSKGWQVNSAEIHGGSVCWMVDMREIYHLNTQLENATEQIETRNDYLRTQNSLKEEQAIINAQNDVYDRITHIIKPQLDAIDELLNQDGDDDFSYRLAKITVYNAYIKRRSNLELLSSESDKLPVSDLITAIGESSEYLKLCNIDTAVSANINGKISASVLIFVYEFFEFIVESVIHTLKGIAVILSENHDTLSVRFVISNAPQLSEGAVKEKFNNINGNISIEADENDTVVFLSLKKERDL